MVNFNTDFLLGLQDSPCTICMAYRIGAAPILKPGGLTDSGSREWLRRAGNAAATRRLHNSHE